MLAVFVFRDVDLSFCFVSACLCDSGIRDAKNNINNNNVHDHDDVDVNLGGSGKTTTTNITNTTNTADTENTPFVMILNIGKTYGYS